MTSAVETFVWDVQAVERLRDLGLSPQVEDIKLLVAKFDFKSTSEFGYSTLHRNGHEWHVVTFAVPGIDEIPNFDSDFELLPPHSIILICDKFQSSGAYEPRPRGSVRNVKAPWELTCQPASKSFRGR